MVEVVVVDSGEASRKKRHLWLWIPLGLLAMIAILVGGFLFWALNPFVQIDDLALNALESGDNVTVTDRAWLAFLPHDPPSTGYIIYPRARVPAEAYAPIARQIAEAGYLVVIVYPPLNLAIINPDLAEPVMEHFSAVEHWVVGGHDIGGAAAGIFAVNNPDSVDGIVFMASSPASARLIDTNSAILSIYGTNDGLTTLDDIDASRRKLPTHTQYVEVEGGNHAQFAYYGTQRGDNPATISQEAQINQIVEATLRFLSSFAH